MKRKVLYACFLALTFSLAPAIKGQSPSDSLLNALETETSDTAKVKILNSLTWIYNSSEPAKAIEYGQEALELSEKNNFLKGKALSLNNLGVIYSIQGSYPKGLEYFLQALTVREELNDKKGISQSTNNIGILYKNLNQYDRSLEYYFKSLAIKEELNDKPGKARTYNNIGEVYQLQEEYEKSLEFHQKSLAFNTELDYKRGIASNLTNIAGIYLAKGQLHEALKMHTDALEIEKEIGNKHGEGISLRNIAMLNLKLGNKSRALQYVLDALEIFETINNKQGVYNSYNLLSSIYSSMNNYKDAYEYSVLASTMRDSIYNEEKRIQVFESQSRYEINKREREIELLKKDKLIQEAELERQSLFNYSLAAGFALIAVIAFIYYRSNKKEKETNKLLEEQKEEISQQKERLEELNYEKNSLMAIVAHDLKSPIAAIQNLAELAADDGEMSKENLETVELIAKISSEGSELITELLDLTNLEEKGDKLTIEDINISELLTKLLSGFRSNADKKKIEIFLNADKDISIRTDKNYLKLVLANLISNAVKYTRLKTNINIDVTIKDKMTEISIKDEGIGLTEDDKTKLFKKFQKLSTKPTGGENSTGLGLAIVKLLVDRLYGKVEVESEVGKGSIFKVIIPDNPPQNNI